MENRRHARNRGDRGGNAWDGNVRLGGTSDGGGVYRELPGGDRRVGGAGGGDRARGGASEWWASADFERLGWRQRMMRLLKFASRVYHRNEMVFVGFVAVGFFVIWGLAKAGVI